jgi:hypothetical protein
MLLAAKIDSRIEPHPISHEDSNTGNPSATFGRYSYKF